MKYLMFQMLLMKEQVSSIFHVMVEEVIDLEHIDLKAVNDYQEVFIKIQIFWILLMEKNYL